MRKLKLALILVSLVLLSLSVYLHSIDRTIVHVQPTSIINDPSPYGVPPIRLVLAPPPWYAKLWFLPLIGGVSLLVFALKEEIMRALKALAKHLEPLALFLIKYLKPVID